MHMPVRLSKTAPIGLPRRAIVLSVLLSLSLCWSGSSTSPANADACGQPSADGCPIDLNQPVTAVLTNTNDVHTWRLQLSLAAPLHIALINLPVDYDAHLYGADGSLLGESTKEGTQDDVVDLPNVDAGSYLIYVNSPRGDTSDEPYTLLVTSSGSAAPVGNGSAASRPSPGQVLLADNFNDPAIGWFSTGPSGGGTRGYVDGGYQLLKTDPTSINYPTAFVPGVYTDSSIAFDVRFVDLQPGVGLQVRCRNNGSTGYRADILPANRTVDLGRLDGDPSGVTSKYLVASQPASVLLPSLSTYHIELTCVGSIIALAINNMLLITAEDTTYSSGNHLISAGIRGKTSDVRLGNLVVIQR
jgi:hypothetical protein